MEEWQKNIIIESLPELIKVTEFTVEVKASLLAKNVLTHAEVEELDAEIDRKGKTSANYKLYNYLVTRLGAFQIFTQILEATKQTGSLRILKNGRSDFEIPKELVDFNDVEIEVQGKSMKIMDLFPIEKLQQIQQIFLDVLTEEELHNSFVTKQKKFVLAISNIPPEPPIYIPRYISNRIEIDESIFKMDCPDVFVFRNNIERYQLSEIARPHPTATSTSQLNQRTARFIHLDEYQDWVEMKNNGNVPIHLISYDKHENTFILEDTTAALEILLKVGSMKERAYINEEEFIQQQLSQDLKVSSVCICDKPGMGKTLLLANISRVMANKFTGTLVAFIQLSAFISDFGSTTGKFSIQQESAFLHVFKYISSSHQYSELLCKLVNEDLIRLEIFFDGFDEIPLNSVEWMKEVFLMIKDKHPNVRIYITSRPHMRHELENTLGVTAYDILPFSIENQVDYLVQNWSPNVPVLDQALLKNYALNCLKEISKNLTQNDKEMAGIPLLCKLIAEIYANKVHFYVNTKIRNIEFPSKVAAMYQAFVAQRIEHVAKNDDEFEDVKLVHCFYALQLLFPTEGFVNDQIFNKVQEKVAFGSVLKAGIIQLQSNTRLDFIHRTFAEYFAAEYFFKKLLKSKLESKAFLHKVFNVNNDAKKLLSLTLNLILLTKEFHGWPDSFVHSVILYFLDFLLNKTKPSEVTKSQVASFFASISTKNVMSILCSCCHHNIVNLYLIFKEAMSQWNWFQRKRIFTRNNCHKLLSICIEESTSQMFHVCVQHMEDVVKLDLTQINTHNKYKSLLRIAAECKNYEAVEYFLDKVSLKNQQLLTECVKIATCNSIEKRENILNLLLNKDPTLIHETQDILCTDYLDVRLFKILVKFGADLTAVNAYDCRRNCAMTAAVCMSPSDYHELVQFLLADCKAEHLFLEYEKWKDPLRHIFRKVKLLPETMELLLNIPAMDISMKDRWEESLLFYAVKEDNLNELQQLVKRGVDYNARDKQKKSLLHVAVEKGGGKEMVRYLLSLKMDPNSLDKAERNPLHSAANSGRLDVVEVLVENGANVQAKDKWGNTFFHLASGEWNDKLMEVFKYLLENGAGINDRNYNGNTPLHCCRESEEQKEFLIEMGADIHATNNEGKTPEQWNKECLE